MEGGKAGRNAFFLLIFTGEDNEGKHFHFKGIVHRKSECDLSGQGSLYGGNQGATGESVVNPPAWMVFIQDFREKSSVNCREGSDMDTQHNLDRGKRNHDNSSGSEGKDDTEIRVI